MRSSHSARVSSVFWCPGTLSKSGVRLIPTFNVLLLVGRWDGDTLFIEMIVLHAAFLKEYARISQLKNAAAPLERHGSSRTQKQGEPFMRKNNASTSRDTDLLGECPFCTQRSLSGFVSRVVTVCESCGWPEIWSYPQTDPFNKRVSGDGPTRVGPVQQ